MLGIAGFSILFCAVSFSAEADRWQSLVDAGNAASHKREIVAARKLYDQALRVAERAGLNDPRVGKTFKLIGDLYFSQIEYDEAKHFYSRAEALAAALRNLNWADESFRGGGFDRAKQSAQTALDQLERTVGHQDVLLTPALISLAKAEKALLQESEAEATLNRALKLLQPSFAESREMASALDLQGQVSDDKNKFAEAEPLLKSALELRRKILDADDPEMEASLEHLAEHYRRTGSIADAESFKKQAIAVQGKGLLNLKEYVDKENGFRLRVPNVWSSPSTASSLIALQVPGALAAFASSDMGGGVLVQRLSIPPGRDSSAIYDSMGQTMAAASKGQDVGQVNVVLSGLPARRIMMNTGFGNGILRDWTTVLVAQNQLWVLHVIGPEEAMASPDSPYYRAAQSISDSFAFLDSVLPTIKAQAVAPPAPLQTITGAAGTCQRYQNREVAMEILLPDGWHESGQTSPSLGQGKIVVLSRVGTLAVVILAREQLEASPELYLKSLQNNLRESAENFRQVSEEKVTRQGRQGTQAVLATRESGIDYRMVMEVFSAGNEHYRVVARAPSEVFDRYATAFDAMLESVQFLPIAGQQPADTLSPNRTKLGPNP
jgi:tetratricopeptide (TPR) repeat protein